MDKAQPTILFLIRSLDVGGAERQLVELLRSLPANSFRLIVATLYDGGDLAAEVDALPHVERVSLSKQGRWDVAGFLSRWVRLCRRVRPDIIHGYLGVANELACLGGWVSGAKIIWGIRASDMDLTQYDWLQQLMFRVGVWFSRFPDAVIYNAHFGRKYHLSQGYSAKPAPYVVSNGINVERFRPNLTQESAAIRDEFKLQPNQKLVGIVARLDPMKDHKNLLRAAKIVLRDLPDCQFILVGGGQPDYTQQLRTFSQEIGVADNIIWAGKRQDVPAIYSACDVMVLCSTTEGFPNVVAEALACGTPVAATNVGDVSYIIQDEQAIVPSGDSPALAAAIKRLLCDPAARQSADTLHNYIAENYSQAQLAKKTAAVFSKVLSLPTGN